MSVHSKLLPPQNIFFVASFLMTSVSSVSKTTEITQVSRKLRLGQQQAIDIIFPLFDQFPSVFTPPRLLSLFLTIYISVQALLLTIWPNSIFYYNKDQTISNALSIFLYVFWFIDPVYSKEKENLGNLIFELIILVVFVSWSVLMIVYYISKKSFFKWTLVITKILYDFVLPIVIVPSSMFFSISIYQLLRHSSALTWVNTVFGFITTLVLFILFKYSFEFESRSVVIPKAIFQTYDYLVFFLYFVFNCSFVTLTYITSTYVDWLQVLITGFHLVSMLYVLRLSFGFSFHKKFDCIVAFTFITSSIGSDITMIVLFFYKDAAADFIPYTILACLVVVCFIIYTLFTNHYYSKVNKAMSSIKEENAELLEANEDAPVRGSDDYFANLGLGHNYLLAKSYLYTALAQHSEYITNSSYFTFLIKAYDTNESVSVVAQVLTFFPFEQRHLNHVYRALISRRDLSIADRFLIYQIYKVKSLRASSTLQVTNDIVNELKEINEQSESNINSFWQLTKPSIPFIETISSNMHKNIISWKEALDMYPNTSKISYEYSRFLAESLTNFEAAIIQKHRANLIESGISFAVDTSFRSFAREYPNYLLDGIVTHNGAKIKKQKYTRGTHASQSTRTSSENSIRS